MGKIKGELVECVSSQGIYFFLEYLLNSRSYENGYYHFYRKFDSL